MTEQASKSQKRMEVCTKCEHLLPNKGCTQCGCYMPLKTKLPWIKCPIGKW